MVKRAAVYSRVSNPGDKRDASLESQEEATIAHMRSLGYTVDPEDVYRERDSGKDSFRPILIDIKQKMRSGYYEALGFYCMDRLVRSQAHCAVLFLEIEGYGCKLVSASNDIGDDSPEGRLIRSIVAYLAEAERLKIEERMGRGKKKMLEKGIYLGMGMIKFGYDYDRAQHMRTARVDEARLVLEIFERSAAGESNHSVANRLNALGVPTPCVRRGMRGKSRARWSTSGIGDILSDPCYKGWTVCNRTRTTVEVNETTGKKSRRKRRLPEEEWIILDRGGVITERIVSDELWEQANRQMRARLANQASLRKPAGSGQQLLRGIAFCGLCGHRLYAMTSTGEGKLGGPPRAARRTYRCRSRNLVWRAHHADVPPCTLPSIKTIPLDVAVWEAFRTLLITPDALEAAIRRIAAKTDTSGLEAELEAARRVLKQKEATRSKLYDKWKHEVESGDDPEFADKLEADFRSLRPLIDSLQQEVKAMEHRHAAMIGSPAAPAAFRERFASLRARLLEADDTTFEERWEALRLAEARVLATPDGFDLYIDLFGERPDGDGVKPDGMS